MLMGPVVGLSLVVTAALDAYQPWTEGPVARLQIPPRQNDAVIAPLVRMATDCIARAVAADPKFKISLPPEDINVLIVASMSACIAPMRAMIDAHDRLYGEGSGEAFFMGPYLDVLPSAVTRQVKGGVP